MSGFIFATNNLPEFIEELCPECYSTYELAKEIVNVVSDKYPANCSITETKLAEKLNVTCRWIQKVCAASFHITFTRLKRVLRIYAALNMLLESEQDIFGIAIDLQYTDATNLARDFKIELHLSPTNAQPLLKKTKPNKLFARLWHC